MYIYVNMYIYICIHIHIYIYIYLFKKINDYMKNVSLCAKSVVRYMYLCIYECIFK